MDTVTVRAFAKINPVLDVPARREDGYHEVNMVMQLLELHDLLTVSWSPAVATEPPAGAAEQVGEVAEPLAVVTAEPPVADAEPLVGDTEPSVVDAERAEGTNWRGLKKTVESENQEVRIGLTIDITCNREDLPCDESNLAYKAAILMAQMYAEDTDKKDSASGAAGEQGKAENLGHGAAEEQAKGENLGHVPQGHLSIHIEKNIPLAAGLAGGSADGAAVLLACNALWEMKKTVAELCEAAAALGSDVPFALKGQARHNPALGLGTDKDGGTCAFATGRGTDLTVLPPLQGQVVLSTPPLAVSTGEVYAGIDALDIYDCREGHLGAVCHPDVAAMVSIMQSNLSPEEIVLKMQQKYANVLELYTLKQYDVVAATKATMAEKAKTGLLLMSGSGPTIFYLTTDADSAKDVCGYVQKMRPENHTVLTSTLCDL